MTPFRRTLWRNLGIVAYGSAFAVVAHVQGESAGWCLFIGIAVIAVVALTLWVAVKDGDQ